MNANLRSLAFPLLLLLALIPARAAETAPAGTPAPVAADSRPVLINIDFPGGSVSKFLSLVAQNERASFNLVATGGNTDLATELPPFALRNADLTTVAGVLRNLLLPRGFELQLISTGPDSVVGTLRPIDQPSPGKIQQHQFESYQLAPYLEQQSVDDIVSAMRAAWELDPAHDAGALRLKFHPPTSILLVSGPSEAVQITRRVLIQLKGAPAKTPKEDKRGKPVPPAEN